MPSLITSLLSAASQDTASTGSPPTAREFVCTPTIIIFVLAQPAFYAEPQSETNNTEATGKPSKGKL